MLNSADRPLSPTHSSTTLVGITNSLILLYVVTVKLANVWNIAFRNLQYVVVARPIVV